MFRIIYKAKSLVFYLNIIKAFFDFSIAVLLCYLLPNIRFLTVKINILILKRHMHFAYASRICIFLFIMLY